MRLGAGQRGPGGGGMAERVRSDLPYSGSLTDAVQNFPQPLVGDWLPSLPTGEDEANAVLLPIYDRRRVGG